VRLGSVPLSDQSRGRAARKSLRENAPFGHGSHKLLICGGAAPEPRLQGAVNRRFSPRLAKHHRHSLDRAGGPSFNRPARWIPREVLPIVPPSPHAIPLQWDSFGRSRTREGNPPAIAMFSVKPRSIGNRSAANARGGNGFSTARIAGGAASVAEKNCSSARSEADSRNSARPRSINSFNPSTRTRTSGTGRKKSIFCHRGSRHASHQTESSKPIISDSIRTASAAGGRSEVEGTYRICFSSPAGRPAASTARLG